MERIFFYFLLLINISILSTPVHANTLFLDNNDEDYQAWEHITILSDVDQSFTIQEMQKNKHFFTKPSTPNGTMGYQKYPLWLHIPIMASAHGEGQWVVDINYPNLYDLEVYLSIENKNAEKIFDRKTKKTLIRGNTLSLSIYKNIKYDLFFKITHYGPLFLPITLKSPKSFLAEENKEVLFQSIIAGLCASLAIYSLIQWRLLNEIIFLFYAIITGSITFIGLTDHGLTQIFLTSQTNKINEKITPAFVLATSIGTYLFTDKAIDKILNKDASSIMHFGAGVASGTLLLFILNIINSGFTSTLGMFSLIFPTTFFLVLFALEANKNIFSRHYFIFIGFFIYSATILIQILLNNAFIAYSMMTRYAFQIGVIVMAVTWIAQLGINLRRQLFLTSKAEIERDELRPLADADPLTGLLNRRGLMAVLDNNKPLKNAMEVNALYILDLDGFKKINDRYGHEIGDQILLSVSHRLQIKLNNRNQICRLGGDEFVIVLNNLNSSSEALFQGEHLRSVFDAPFILGDKKFNIGTTIGYVLFRNNNNMQKLLQHADTALYSGKRNGKNCVVCYQDLNTHQSTMTRTILHPSHS